MKNRMFITIIAVIFSFISCKNEKTPASQSVIIKDKAVKNDKNSFISIFEIPATDISRAISFYEEILDIKIERIDFPEIEMGLFPFQDQIVTVVIIKGKGYEPSTSGVTIYLNGGNNLQTILDKVEKNGGKIIIPKTSHADESGYFAIFQDSEGNKMGLHSPN